MLAQLADLRLCALMSLGPYVPMPLCLRPYVMSPFFCAFMSGFEIRCIVSCNILAVNNNPLKDFP